MVFGSFCAGSVHALVDDNPKLCRMVKEYLEPLGYEVSLAHTGLDGLEKALNGDFHAIILDVMLPGLDGFAVLKQFRAQSAVPVLMLTGRGEAPGRIAGLELGADDYIPKTFSPRELLARLRAVIRHRWSPLRRLAGHPNLPSWWVHSRWNRKRARRRFTIDPCRLRSPSLIYWSAWRAIAAAC
jgi:DNA-binding response OmpR family regulator